MGCVWGRNIGRKDLYDPWGMAREEVKTMSILLQRLGWYWEIQGLDLREQKDRCG